MVQHGSPCHAGRDRRCLWRPGYLTGWSARGFPKLAGFAWYRLRIHPSNASAVCLAQDAGSCRRFLSGLRQRQFIGELGRFTPRGVDSYRSRPLVFQLPPPDAHGDILLAIRFYMEPWVLVSGSTAESGGMHEAPLVGYAFADRVIRAQEITGRILSVIVPFFVALFMLIVRRALSGSGCSIAPARPILWLTLGLVLLAASIPARLSHFFLICSRRTALILLGAGFQCFWLCLLDFLLATMVLASPRALVRILMGSRLQWASFLRSSSRWSAHAPVALILFIEFSAVCKAMLGIMLFADCFRARGETAPGAWSRFCRLPCSPSVCSGPMLLSGSTSGLRSSRSASRLRVKEVAHGPARPRRGALALRRFVASQVSQRLERQMVEQRTRTGPRAAAARAHSLSPSPRPSSRSKPHTILHVPSAATSSR